MPVKAVGLVGGRIRRRDTAHERHLLGDTQFSGVVFLVTRVVYVTRLVG